jgi:uncharacterized protein (DUF1778 family)
MRPRKPDSRRAKIDVRLADDQIQLICSVAKEVGLNPSTFMRSAAVLYANQIRKDQSRKSARQFTEVL